MTPTTLANRYILQAQLGAGGMGEVHRAYDRLSGNYVALKLLPHAFADSDSALTREYKLALTREFQMMASLRHPHVINVLDYGFAADGQPYFTMEPLVNARSLRDYGAEVSSQAKVQLVMQLLQALHYLHRRGVIHRDLKPENVLVTPDGRLRVLDFGLAHLQAIDGVADPLAGTLLYMAPEVLGGESPTTAVDLYAVGALAYELFAGQPPFADADNVPQLVEQILHVPPNERVLHDCAIVPVIMRLLAKTRQVRYGNALDALRHIEALLPALRSTETHELRESFLQAADFVGREAEMAKLSESLEATRRGQGCVWLVGGESGVGKTRLLDELRIRALVSGFQVLRGQAVEGGGLPYQIWREPLRRLILSVELSDLEAGILQAIVPDISALLNRVVSDAPELDEKAAQQRLYLAIVDLFQRQMQPIVLLLEDLQWMNDGLDLLKQFAQLSEQRPIFILASYRDDERPALPQALPATVHPLKLERLKLESIAALTTSMIGEVGSEPDVVSWLQRETEGNVFFLVEVVRALAEEAGDLAHITRVTLPRGVLSGGIQQVMQRRLTRMPASGQPLLRLAAVGGRRLDLRLLSELVPSVVLEPWLHTGSEAAILEWRDDQWRFSHDKLREAILNSMDAAERSQLHRQVAETIESVYMDDEAYAETLAEHWEAAGEMGRALPYMILVARRLIGRAAEYSRVEQLIQRGLTYGDAMQQATLLHLYGDMFERQGQFAEAGARYEASLKAAGEDAKLRSEALNGLSRVWWRQSNYGRAGTYAQQALEAARSIGDRRGIATSLNNLGSVESSMGEYQLSRQHHEESLQLFRLLGDRQGVAGNLNKLGIVAAKRGDFAAARGYIEESLEAQRALGDRYNIAHCLNNLGNIAYTQKDYKAAQTYYEEGMSTYTAIGDRLGVAISLSNLGLVAEAQGDYSIARAYYEESVRLRRPVGERYGRTKVQLDLVTLLLRLGQPQDTHHVLAEALQTANTLQAAPLLAHALVAAAQVKHVYCQDEIAATWVGLVSAQGTLEAAYHPLLQQVSSDLEKALGAEKFKTALARGKTLELNIVVQALLKEFAPRVESNAL